MLQLGGFGTEVTVKTDENLKQSLGGAAYVITGSADPCFSSQPHQPSPCTAGITHAQQLSVQQPGHALMVAVPGVHVLHRPHPLPW